MPRRIEVLPASDFTGGLNLRADAFQLRGNESPDMLNVDVDPQGGVRTRKSIDRFTAPEALAFTPHSIMSYQNRGGTKQILVGHGAQVSYQSGTSWVTIIEAAGTPWTQSVTTGVRGVTFVNQAGTGESLFMVNGTNGAREWTGANPIAAALASAPVEDFAAPGATTYFPRASYIASHHSMIFVANTTGRTTVFTNETNDVRYPNRVRFSHPNKPGSWRSNDYIDVDPFDGDEITGIVSHRGKLYVFKNRSVHVINGYGPSSFTAEKIVDTCGAVHQDAIVSTEGGIFFWSSPKGLYVLDNTTPNYLFEKIQPALLDGTVPPLYHSKVRLGWVERRLYISLPWGSAANVNTQTLVYDPSIGEGGAYVMYGTGFAGFLSWNPGGQEHLHVALRADSNKVSTLEASESGFDEWGAEYLLLNGATTDYVTAPDTAGLSITGDIDLQAKVAMDDWTPGTTSTIGGKWNTTGNQKSYLLQIDTAGRIKVAISADGANALVANSTVTLGSVGFLDGETRYVRATVDVVNAATTGWDANFYYSADGVTWTALGATVTTATSTSIFNSTASVQLGSHEAVGTEIFEGTIYWFKVYSGFDIATQQLRGFFDASAATPGAPTYTDSIGNIWTLSGTSELIATTSTNFESFYLTKWFDAENAALVKKWKRPDIVLDGDNTITLDVDVFLDYTPGFVRKSFTLNPEASSTALTWNDGSAIPSMYWYDGVTYLNQWAESTTGGSQEILKGGLIGRARAVQLKIKGPTSPSGVWAINSLLFKYIPKRIR